MPEDAFGLKTREKGFGGMLKAVWRYVKGGVSAGEQCSSRET